VSDILKSEVIVGGTGNSGSMFGVVTLYDNHGNSTRGYNLTCSGHAPIKMPLDDWIDLHHAINPHAVRALNLNGTIPVLGGMESPLQTMCRKLDAQAHHSPVPKGHTR
jgi:hypothetical protein